jgi:putative ABC transport system permease protein
VFAGSQAQHDRLSYVPDAATGTFLVGTLGDPGHGLTPDAVDTITSLVDDADLVTGSLRPVPAVAGDGSSSTVVWVLPPKAARGDTLGYTFSAPGTVVDDGTSVELLQLLGVPEPWKAAAALRAEKVVVSPTDLGDDGTATLSIADAGAEGGSRTVTVPAAAVGDGIGAPTNLPLIPTDVAQDLGLRTHTSALVAPVRDGAWSTAVQNSLDDALVAALPAHENQGGGLRYAAASAYVEPGHASWGTSQGLAELLIVAGALSVALAAAWIATALAGTESLPDLATLQAVGAPPRTRRRFAAAQSAVITVTGAVLGAATGLVIGATLVLSQREQGTQGPDGDVVDPRWMVDVPWVWVAALVVAIPLLGAAAAWLVTRSRLPLARRLDG